LARPSPGRHRSIPYIIEIIQVLFGIVSSGLGHETILRRDETIFRFWRRTPETAGGYQANNKSGGQRRKAEPETVKCEPLASSLPSLSSW
jgi:hypothetical protein